MAIPNSRGVQPIAHGTQRSGAPRRQIFFRTLLFAMLVAPGVRSFAADTSPPAAVRPAVTETLLTVRARKAYNVARAHFQTQTNSAEAAWQFGRACFDLAEWAADSDERAALANEGIAVCKQLIARAGDSAAAHYYLGMNLGQLARTKGLGALKLVEEMEREFTVARDLDASFDYAGSDRNLALLYRDVPSFSIGSKSKARQHLKAAVELAPDFPENRLNLVETYLKWSDRPAAQREFNLLEKIWPEAKKTLSGDEWDASWFDWNKRYAVVKRKLEDAARPLESPKESK